jgi:hypothetical protein
VNRINSSGSSISVGEESGEGEGASSAPTTGVPRFTVFLQSESSSRGSAGEFGEGLSEGDDWIAMLALAGLEGFVPGEEVEMEREARGDDVADPLPPGADPFTSVLAFVSPGVAAFLLFAADAAATAPLLRSGVTSFGTGEDVAAAAAAAFDRGDRDDLALGSSFFVA